MSNSLDTDKIDFYQCRSQLMRRCLSKASNPPQWRTRDLRASTWLLVARRLPPDESCFALLQVKNYHWTEWIEANREYQRNPTSNSISQSAWMKTKTRNIDVSSAQVSGLEILSESRRMLFDSSSIASTVIRPIVRRARSYAAASARANMPA